MPRVRDVFILKGKLAGAAGELVGVEIHLVEQMHEEIAERRVVLGIVCEITAVFEAAAGEQDGVVGLRAGFPNCCPEVSVLSSKVPPASLVFMVVRNSSKQPMMARSILSNCSIRLGSRP